MQNMSVFFTLNYLLDYGARIKIFPAIGFYYLLVLPYTPQKTSLSELDSIKIYRISPFMPCDIFYFCRLDHKIMII
ncbi:MAG: hypothetical protein DRQ62_15955 [Gammaproteobacteria bacterium]|nr:MAG: hypothetical protein DRQ62_15955 [Gammaproteobacteria bacterium]